MSNIYFVAKFLWESGQRAEPLEQMGAYLEARLGQPVLRVSDFARRAGSDRHAEWAVDFSVLLQHSETLVAPLARVFPVLWELDPSLQTLITLMPIYAFPTDPDEMDWLNELNELVGIPPYDWRTTAADFARAAETLAEAARTGLLTLDPAESRSMGIAWLDLDALPERTCGDWAPLVPYLQDLVPPAYAARPADCWAHQAHTDPVGMVARMLHNAFGLSYAAPRTCELALERIEHLAPPSYYQALCDALDQTLASASQAELDDMARYDAVLPTVADGRAWLGALREALAAREFGDFIAATAPLRRTDPAL